MASSTRKLFSDFASSSPMSYYGRIGGQYFTQSASSPSFLTSLFENKKNNSVSTSKAYHPTLVSYSNATLLTPISHTHRLKRYSFSIAPSNNLSATRFLLILLLITAVGISQNEVHAAESSVDLDKQLEKVSLLLEQNQEQRSIEKRITLFNALLSIGNEAANKARGKDIILVFGNTGAGKSTLINFIYGCKMAKAANGGIIVDPKSPVKEVAPIGIGSHSCTFIPKEIPDIKFTITDTSEEGVSSQPRETSITCFDMPGLSDDRGIEVVLANTIIMQRVIENAQSVRFVMVFEESLLTAEKGNAWKKAVKLLSERFDGYIGGRENSLCLVITKGSNNPDTIKTNIKEHTPEGYFDLSKHFTIYYPLDKENRTPEGYFDFSNHLTVYEPLNKENRKTLLNRLYKTTSYKGLDTNITLGGDQLWAALKLGEDIEKEISRDLAEAYGAGVDKAINKIKFTHGIKNLKGRDGDRDLAKPHAAAAEAVQKYTGEIIKGMKANDATIQDQIAEYKAYKEFKGKCEKFVGFEASDKEVEKIKYQTKDPRRWVAWDKPDMSTLSGAVTITATIAAVILSSPAAAVAAVAAGSGMVYSVKRWLFPTDDEKDLTEFCRK